MIALYIFGGIILLFLLIAAIIGTGWSFEKSILLKASMDRVWREVSTLHAINAWNPWLERDPQIKQSYTGEDGLPGASYAWESDVKMVGAGNQTIVSVSNQSELATRINFLKPFKGTGLGYINIAPEGGATRVSWKIVSSTPYPMNIMKLFGVMEKSMDRDFGSGLNKLKSLCEK
jgi:hypothetical protein